MKRLVMILGLVALGFAALVAFAPTAATQPTGWLSYLLQDPQGVSVQFRALSTYGQPVLIGHGTAAPTAANSGVGPIHGEVYLVRDNAGAGEPVTTMYSNAATAWRSLVPSTLATNAIDVANSVWFGNNQITAEGATANGFELDLEFANVGQDQDVYLGDYGEADTSLIVSLVDDMDIGEANAIWHAAAGVILEGATPDGFELTLGAVDPGRDATINFNGSVAGTVGTTRASAEGYSLRFGYPNPWRLDFREELGHCTGLLEGYGAVMGAADTNVNQLQCGTAGFEFYVEQAAAVGIAGLITDNANGWFIELDDTDNEGVQGIPFGGDDDVDNFGWGLVAGTDSGYFEVRFRVTDSSETDQVLFGMLMRATYPAGAQEDAFNTYCLVGIDDAVADPRDIVVSEEADADGGANTDTTINIVDNTAITVRVEIDAGGQCDIYVNGALTNNNVMGAGGAADGFDAADWIVPFFQHINSAGDGTPDADLVIEYWEVGYLN